MEVKNEKRHRLYRFLNEEGRLLYIGRSANVKARINKQHFGTRPMPCLAFGGYDEVYKIQITNEMTYLEAVLLEAAMIRNMAPKYNQEFNYEECELPHVLEFIDRTKSKMIDWFFFSWNPKKPVDDQMLLFEEKIINQDKEKGFDKDLI